MANIDRLIQALKRDEALRLKPYRCSAGKLTIGVGRNLEDVGISEQEALVLLDNDITRLLVDTNLRPILDLLDDVRQEVILNMAFNIGVNGLLKFKNMLVALALKDYGRAADEMINSRWFNQVGSRAVRLVSAMRTGTFKQEA